MPLVKRLISFIAVLSLAFALNCSAQEKVDLDAISKIRYPPRRRQCSVRTRARSAASAPRM